MNGEAGNNGTRACSGGILGGLFDFCGPNHSLGSENSFRVVNEDELMDSSPPAVGDLVPASAFGRIACGGRSPKSIAPSYSASDQDDTIDGAGITHVQVRPKPLGKSVPEVHQSANLQPRLAGIGIAFEAVPGGSLIIYSFSPGGAAEELGRQGVLRAGDELLAVDGRPVIGKQGRSLAAMLIGNEGSAARVSFRRWTDGAADERRAYDVTVDLVRRAPADSDRRRSRRAPHDPASVNAP
jgi:hypothetical protein